VRLVHLYDPVLKKLIKCCEAEFIEDQRLKDIDRVNVDDPTHDEDRENCHEREVQFEVEPVAHIKSTHVRKPLKRYTAEGVAIAIDNRMLMLAT
jgi:FKBP-type peptidyl-prolyl cis-trans isomerase (trigger factor)